MSSGQISDKVKCTGCGSDMDGFTGVSHDAKPKDGDLSICFYCGSIGKYADNVTSLKSVPAEELERISIEDPELFRQLSSIVDEIKKMRDN